MEHPRGLEIMNRYPKAFFERLFEAHCETLSRWVLADVLKIPGGHIIG